MADTRLEASLEMQVDQAIRALRQVRKEIGDIPKNVKPAVDSLNKFEKSQAGATNTLINFGRVVQDAPYTVLSGNIAAIANNIDPLIESFGRLKQQTGSTGAALRQLAGSLIGPAGLGLGISFLTSALVLLGPKLGEIFSGTEKLTDEQKEAAKAAKELADNLSEQIVSVQSLSAIVQDENRSRRDRLAALDELRKRYPSYLKNLSDEKALSGGIAVATDAITQSLIRRVVIDAARAKLTDQISKALETALQNEEALRAEDERLNKVTPGSTNFDKRYEAYTKTTIGLSNVTKLYGRDAKLANGEAAKSFGTADLAALRIFNTISGIVSGPLKDLIGSLGGQALDFTDSFGGKDKNNKVKELNQDLAEYQLTILDAETKQRAYGDAVLRTFQIEERLSQLRKKETASQIDDLIANVNNNAIAKVAESYKQIPEAINNARANNKALGDDIKKDLLDNINDVVTGFNTIQPLIDQTFNALANGENVFDSLKQGVKRLIVDLLKAVALAAILSALPGGGATATGLTALIGKLLNFKGFRAGGGPVQAGGSYIVGEKGPELFVPENGGRIIPNSALMSGGGAMGGVLTARVEGSDLLFVLERAQRSAGRRR